MKLVKKVFKNRLFIFVTTALLFSVIGVSAATYFPSNDVTYDNSSSGLKSTDVQGAIDELYEACSVSKEITIDDLKENVVTSGDGLYKDNYESGKYTYKGANPNNYITFNGEEWRIISLSADGTIKILKTESIGEQAWSYSGNNWATADVNKYLNNTYFNLLISNTKSQIATYSWSIGGVKYYEQYLDDQIDDENYTKWQGNIGLISASEYIRANSNISNCGSYYKLVQDASNHVCASTNWMYISDLWWWTLSSSTSSKDINYIDGDSNLRGDGSYYANRFDVRPVVNLKSGIVLSGKGTQSNPYTIQ